MNGIPPESGACCPPRAEGITYLKVGARSIVTGMMGLETMFQQLLAMGRRPEEATDAELIGMARCSNYIAARAALEADYAAELREGYARFCTLQKASKGERGQK